MTDLSSAPAGNRAAVSDDELAAAFPRFRGELVRPGDAGYDAARHVWNTRTDGHPALIACCSGVADVIDTVTFARTSGRLLAVRAGGHSIAGKSTVDDGVVVDLRGMRHTRIDPAARRAWVEGGATWGDYDREAQRYGLASPGGAISMTGVAGVTLGGGFGWLGRRYGLACDSVVSMEVVLASGEVVTCSRDAREDLFWALRGGGGNFGVVTGFEFELHEVGPDILTGVVGWPLDQAAAVLAHYAPLAPGLPDAMGLNIQMVTAPPMPEIPAALHGRQILILIYSWADADVEAGLAAIAPLREFGTPAFDTTAVARFLDLQSSNDVRCGSMRSVWRGGWLDDLGDAIDTIVAHHESFTSPMCLSEFISMSGAIAATSDEDSAFTRREGWVYNVLAMWEDAADDDLHLGWAGDFHAALRQHAGEGAYINFLSEGEDDRVAEAYHPAKLARLREVKRDYDAANLFSVNHNIPPAE